MADINPEEARRDPEKADAATHEHSGYSIEGDTPPAEGLGVGPTNNDLDADRKGDGTKGKTTLVVLLILVVIFLVLWIAGAVVGML